MDTVRIERWVGLPVFVALLASLAACGPSPVTTPAATLTPVPPTDTPPPASPTYTLSPLELLPPPTLEPMAAPTATAGPPFGCSDADRVFVYLVFDGHRRMIINFDTLIDLGFKETDLVDCGAASSLRKSGGISGLLKGSGDPVYLMDHGVRRHIPDMDTLALMGYGYEDIATVPDEVLAQWPPGEDIDASAVPTWPLNTVTTIGGYTFRVWRHFKGQGLDNFATISQPNQPDIELEAVVGIEELAVNDVTGDGRDDVVFLRHWHMSRCCWGATVYDIGPTPVKVLDIATEATGGLFKDLDGDGAYEFITTDSLLKGVCSTPSVTTVVSYDPGRHSYIGAAPRFASYYAAEIAQLNARTKPGDVCTVSQLVTTLLYIGRTDEARAAFDRLYTGEDAARDWHSLQIGVHSARYYVPAQ